MDLEINDLDLYPGEYKPVLEDNDAMRVDDNWLDDEGNETYFDPVRYYFLVRIHVCANKRK